VNAEPYPDLTAAPYGLDAEAIAWVESTIDSMAEDEKVGQLFINLNNRFEPCGRCARTRLQ
jgi:beta-N-acetylhexosaminidase